MLVVMQGRRYVADGQQSLRDLVDAIEARTVSNFIHSCSHHFLRGYC